MLLFIWFNELQLSKRPSACLFFIATVFHVCPEGILSFDSGAKCEFNAEVNQPYEAYVMAYILAVSFEEKTF